MKKMLTGLTIARFQKKIYDHYAKKGRKLPWRGRASRYAVLVSEIMLQQTQVERVIPKYKQFLEVFPDFRTLAHAPTARLLAVWSGMGYNRRALALRSLAEKVVEEHGCKLPSEPEKLLVLPGIGKYTAGAIQAFAFNKPVVFMDTNIRRVFIHEFFQDRHGIHDDELVPLVEQTLDLKNPRKWYNALMDYGAVLKGEQGNPNRRSAHYTRQSPFRNSNREVRGSILKALVQESPLSEAQIVKKTKMDRERVKNNLVQLEKEGFIKKKNGGFHL